MIDLRNVETFVWAATLGSFRAAAEKLNTTQPTVSQRIAALEADLDQRLFERDPRGVFLTPKGHELLIHAQRMLQVRRDMQDAARSREVVAGTVRLGVSETIEYTWLSTLIETMHEAYPALLLEIEVDTSPGLRALLLSRQIDLAFMMGPVQDADVENIELCRYPMAWVASPRLGLGEGRLTLPQVADWPIVTHSSSTRPYRIVRDMLIEAGVASPRMYGSASLSTIVRMARKGIGTSVVAPVVLKDELASGELRILDVDAKLPELLFTASWFAGPDSLAPRTIAELGRRIARGEGGLG